MIAPPWFRGVWKREWIRYGEAAPFEDRIVRDVQTPSVFGSVRIPHARPSARSFADLDDAALRILLTQKGFAGIATFDDDVATWHHAIDFQPAEVDTARIVPQTASTVLEVGLDDEFAELWWNIARDDRYLGIEWTRGDRVHALLAVVGDHFVYARNRPHDLPTAARSLADIATTRAEMLAVLDCELSYGQVRGGRVPWEIRHSTLPWREGEPAGVTLDGGSVLVNTFTPEDRDRLFAP